MCNQVWILKEGCYCEGSTIVGVFDSEQAAEEMKEKITAGREYPIEYPYYITVDSYTVHGVDYATNAE
ncbi:MAG: DUF7336 domain-containing protein [Plesiomonas shigelloides]